MSSPDDRQSSLNADHFARLVSLAALTVSLISLFLQFQATEHGSRSAVKLVDAALTDSHELYTDEELSSDAKVIPDPTYGFSDGVCQHTIRIRNDGGVEDAITSYRVEATLEGSAVSIKSGNAQHYSYAWTTVEPEDFSGLRLSQLVVDLGTSPFHYPEVITASAATDMTLPRRVESGATVDVFFRTRMYGGGRGDRHFLRAIGFYPDSTERWKARASEFGWKPMMLVHTLYFASGSSVTGPPLICFYAGAPVVSN